MIINSLNCYHCSSVDDLSILWLWIGIIKCSRLIEREKFSLSTNNGTFTVVEIFIDISEELD